MDLQEYERLKFELADLVREAESAQGGGDDPGWREILTGLAEDRFTVVVAGRFSRGKSSLMNALLGSDRLPTGVVPLTSVITSVRYGTSERVLLRYRGRRLDGEASMAELAEYVTERGNPANVKGLRSAEIQLPCDLLRRGVFFVDTPGLGSAIPENSETTEAYIPEIDMLLLVTGFESPLSEDEVAFLRRAAGRVRALFVVVNKQDLVPSEVRQEVLEYVERGARAALGARPFRIFSVSARDGMRAKLESDPDSLRSSGIEALEAELVLLLSLERAQLFLASMCDRIVAKLPLEGSEELWARLRSLEERLRRVPSSATASAHLETGREDRDRPTEHLLRYPGACDVCSAVQREQFAFLSRYQLELSTRPSVRERHAEAGGFCPFHSWEYERITSPRAVCTALPELLARTAGRLRAWATRAPGAPAPSDLVPRCALCELRRNIELRVVAAIVADPGMPAQEQAVDGRQVALCIPHLRAVIEGMGDPATRRRLLNREAAWLERIAEDMQRYAVKVDGLRRGLASEEESAAPLNGVQLLAGHQGVATGRPLRDEL